MVKLRTFIATIILICILTQSLTALANLSEYTVSTVNNILNNTSLDNLQSKGAILTDLKSGKVLFEKNSRHRLPAASLVKIMSLYLIMKALDEGNISLTEEVTISEYVENVGGSTAYLAQGEKFTIEELIKAVAISSANDATVALAEKISGSESSFVSLMNQTAENLGLKDSNFLDASGLTNEGQYTSAADVALISRELVLNYPKVLEYTAVALDSLRDGAFRLDNTNKLVIHYPKASGLRTGYTSAAGFCLGAVAMDENYSYISVIMGAPDSNTRFAESIKLLDHGFLNYEYLIIETEGTSSGAAPVKDGVELQVKGLVAEDVILLLDRREADNIERVVELNGEIEAPVDKGDIIGSITYVLDGEKIHQVNVMAETDVLRASFFKRLFRKIMNWFGF